VLDITLTEPVNKDIASEAAREVLTFDERVSDLSKLIRFEPLIREIDYKVLKYCLEPRRLSDIEERIAGYPEFKFATRDQYTLITELANHYGLVVFELDEAGKTVLESDKEGLSEDEIDDLVVDFAYQTTEVGKVVIDKLDPKHRLIELLDSVPQRYDAYIKIMEFLREKHTFADIDLLFLEQGMQFFGGEAGDQAIQPSVFVDKLERAGGVFFDGGWQITQAGVQLLAAINGRSQD
jgi:hypothetical protein